MRPRRARVTPGHYVVVNVSDTGTGIPPEILERVFEPFFTTKETGRGTGLGLSMVYGFIKQSKGHVKIYSEVGHGTSVRLYFPCAQSPAATMSATSDVKGQLPAGRETILVVEDDAAVRNMAIATLESLGYKVLQAKDGRSGLDMIRDRDGIDLLFTDMIMPNGMSGLDLIREARQLRPGIKALLTSGYSEQFIQSVGDAPGVKLLSKPYRKEKLATTIRVGLDGSAGSG